MPHFSGCSLVVYRLRATFLYVAFLSSYLYFLSSSSDLQEMSAGVLDRNKGYYTTPLGRSDGSGPYSYSSRGGSSGGRWETRSSGSSDRDGDLPDRDSSMQGTCIFTIFGTVLYVLLLPLLWVSFSSLCKQG
jgi:hypothetical protein